MYSEQPDSTIAAENCSTSPADTVKLCNWVLMEEQWNSSPLHLAGSQAFWSLLPPAKRFVPCQATDLDRAVFKSEALNPSKQGDM